MDLSQLSDEQLNQLEAQIRQQQAAPPRIDLSSLSNEQLDELEKKVRGDTVGTAEAFGRGAAQGLSFGFGDEMRGILAAGGLEKGQPGSLYGLVKGLAKYWGGDEEAARRYVETVTEERRRTQLAEQQHPTASTLGELGGSLLIPGLDVAQGASWGARALRAGKTGALWGALSGAGAGEDLQSRALGAAGGGVVGGALGAVASPVIDWGLHYAAQPAQQLQRALFPQQAAERMMAAAAARAEKLEPSVPGGALPRDRLTQAELAANPQAALIDVAGLPGRELARAAANISPEARNVLERLVNDRFAGQGDRVIAHLNRQFHYPDPDATMAALEKVSNTVNRTNYARAFSQGDRPIMTAEMQDMVLRSPAMQNAIRRAIPSVQDRAVSMGMGARNPGIRFEAGLPVFDRGPPNLQFWDTVKRELDAMANRAGRIGDANQGSYAALATKLRTELDNEVPSYATARQGAARYFGAENASDAGVKFFNNDKMSAEQGRQALARFSPMERQLFEDSFGREYINNISKRGDRTNVLNQIQGSPLAREKLNVAMGPQRVNQIESLLRSESIMDRARGAFGNSSTIRQWATIMGLGGIGGYFEGENPKDVSLGALLGATLKLGHSKFVNERVMHHLGDLMASRDTAAFARGHAAFAKSEARMNVLRNLDNLTAKAVGSQVGSRL